MNENKPLPYHKVLKPKVLLFLCQPILNSSEVEINKKINELFKIDLNPQKVKKYIKAQQKKFRRIQPGAKKLDIQIGYSYFPKTFIGDAFRIKKTNKVCTEKALKEALEALKDDGILFRHSFYGKKSFKKPKYYIWRVKIFPEVFEKIFKIFKRNEMIKEFMTTRYFIDVAPGWLLKKFLNDFYGEYGPRSHPFYKNLQIKKDYLKDAFRAILMSKTFLELMLNQKKLGNYLIALREITKRESLPNLDLLILSSMIIDFMNGDKTGEYITEELSLIKEGIIKKTRRN